MCERKDSIEALGRAADGLTQACQTHMQDAPDLPVEISARLASCLRRAFHVPFTIPDDIDALVRRIK